MVCGRIAWETYDRRGRLLDSGEKVVSTRQIDIHCLRANAPSQWSKSHELTEGFRFGISDVIRSEKRSGFGLTMEASTPSFCWEWFSIVSEGNAKKLQEDGELAFTEAEGPRGREIRRIEFLTDVSMRVTKFGPAMLFPPIVVKWPDWRVRILKGSWIEWPAS